MNAVTKTNQGAVTAEQVLVRGDLSALDETQRVKYYADVCNSVGLNPLTKPFAYITLNGKLQLYALKDCTDQLRSIHGISVTELIESEREGVFIVKAKVCNKEGRTDVSTGAVNINGLRGEALANALMKSETKAKRRATLSICGLGMLDETEIEDIPASPKAPIPSPKLAEATVTTAPPIVQPAKPSEGPHKIVGGTYQSWSQAYMDAIGTAGDKPTVHAWLDANTAQLEKLAIGSPHDAATVRAFTFKHLAFLHKTDPAAMEVQPEAIPDMGKEAAPAPAKPPRGRPKATKLPDFDKDYDGWMAYQLGAIAKAPHDLELEAIFEVVDTRWDDLMPPDKDTLVAARREAEARLKG